MVRSAVLLLMLAGMASAQDEKPLPEGASLDVVVHAVQGEADVRVEKGGKWETAVVGLTLKPGSRVCTGMESAILLSLGTNGLAHVCEASVLDIVAYGMEGDQLVGEFNLDPGSARFLVGQRPGFRAELRPHTPSLHWFMRRYRVVPGETTSPEVARKQSEVEARAREESDRSMVRYYEGPDGYALNENWIGAGKDADRFMAEVRDGTIESAEAFARFQALWKRLAPAEGR